MRWILTLLCAAALVGADEKKDPPAKPAKGDTGLTGVLTEKAFKALHELTEEKRPPLKGKAVKVGAMTAYLSLPKGAGPHPGVVVIHEWWGLNVHVKHWADRLAADGYAALAIDLYGGNVAKTRDDAMKYMRTVEKDKAVKQLLAAHAFLKSDARIRAKKRAVIGWCFGGGFSLQLALHAKDLDAAIIYYGRLQTDPETLGAIKAEVLGIFGTRDRGIPPRTVKAFADGLTAAKVKHTIHSYAAPHAFANPSSARYDQKAATAAWAEVRKFLARKLKG
ncbi:MAG: dienelactone hydrolase family protein [Planctomycetota bacterium]|nr:dienelactone hydrolase family protein [Planctomycetota bacterium]